MHELRDNRERHGAAKLLGVDLTARRLPGTSRETPRGVRDRVTTFALAGKQSAVGCREEAHADKNNQRAYSLPHEG